MHACPPAVAVAKAPRGKGPKTKAEARRRRARRQVETELDARHHADVKRAREVAQVLNLPSAPQPYRSGNRLRYQ